MTAIGLAIGIGFQSGAGGVTQSAIIAAMSGATGSFADISDLSTLYQDRSATPTTPAGVGDVVGTILDVSGNGNHWIATDDAHRGVLTLDGGRPYIAMDGDRDGYLTGWNPTGTPSAVVAYRVDDSGSAANYVLLADGVLGRYALTGEDGSATTTISANSGTPTYRLNGATWTPADRNAVYDGLEDIDAVVTLESLSLSAWDNFGVSAYPVSTYGAGGRFYGAIVIDRAFADADERALFEQFFASRSGVTLP